VAIYDVRRHEMVNLAVTDTFEMKKIRVAQE
jgi:hypothetical protein